MKSTHEQADAIRTIPIALQAGALVFAFIAMVVANYVVTQPSTGAVRYTNTQIANTHPVYGLPIGFAFAVWGVIYTLQGLFVAYQAVPCGGLNEPKIEAIRAPILGIFAINSVWLFLFGFERFWMAEVVIVLYAVLLFIVLKRLDVNMLSSLPSAGLKLSAAAFSANASWVTVASCLGLQVTLFEEGWLPSDDFAIGLLVIAVAIACAATFRWSDPVYAAVAAWALGGLVANQADSSDFGCNTQICPACLDANVPICTRVDTSSYDGRPNGFAALHCAAYNSSVPRECVVDKSEAIVSWAWAGISCVLAALLVGVVHGLVRRANERKREAMDARGLRLNPPPAMNAMP